MISIYSKQNSKNSPTHVILYYTLISLILFKWVLLPKTLSVTELEKKIKFQFQKMDTYSKYLKNQDEHTTPPLKSLNLLLKESGFNIIKSNSKQLQIDIQKANITSQLKQLFYLLKKQPIPISEIILNNTKNNSNISVKLNIKKPLRKEI